MTLKLKLLWPLLAGVMISTPGIANPQEHADHQQASPVKVGVAAFANPASVAARWQPTIDYLSDTLGRQFSLTVLSPVEQQQAVANDQIDFLISNPVSTVTFKQDFGINQLLSLVGSHASKPEQTVGSAIISRQGEAPTDWEALKNLKIVSSAPEAFGGFQIFAGALAAKDIDAQKDLKNFSFRGFPQENLLKLVLSGEADIAILPTCVLENAVTKGDIPKHSLTVALTESHIDYPCHTSTPLYPGYAFSRLGHTDHQLGASLVKALLSMEANHPAKTAGRYQYWTVPVDDRQVFALLKTLQRWPFVTNWERLLQSALPWLLGGGIIFLLGGLHHLWVQRLVHVRTRALQTEMQDHSKTQQALLDQQKQFFKAQRVLLTGEMASGISHELKQPLAGIRYLTQGCLYRLKGSEPELQTAMHKVIEQVDRAQDTINRLRSFCQQDSQRCRLDLSQLLDETLNLMRPDFKRIKLEPKLELQPGQVYADPSLMQQVIVNLIRNSLDAMDETQAPKLEITLKSLSETVIMEIIDNGKGLSDSQLERLFMPFETSKPQGTGLGMVICKRIVEEHQGQLEAVRLEQGLCMRLSLPAASLNFEDPMTAIG